MAIGDGVLKCEMDFFPNFSEVEICHSLLEELCSSDSLRELEEILSRMNNETSVSEILFKKKFLFLIWEDLLAYQKPMGKMYKKSIAVCIGKKRPNSSHDDSKSIMRLMATKLSFLHLGGIPFDQSENESYNQALVSTFRKYFLYPMPEVIGRKILEMCMCFCDKNVIKYPILCICHPKKSRTGMIVGSSIINNSSVSVQKTGNIKRQDELPSLYVLKKDHLVGLPSASLIETSVLTCYEFLEYEAPENDRSLKPILGTSLSIQSEWSNVLAILEPLQPDCKTLVKVQVKTGHSLSGACNLHMELAQIEHFHKCLKGLSVMNTESNLKVLQELEKFMIDQKPKRPVKGHMYLNQIIKGDKSLKSFDKVVMNQRLDLDYVDKLWLLLKDVSSVSELKAALRRFYVMLCDYRYAPVVCCKKMSKIAADVRKLEENVMSPVLNDSVILKLLIEIGVEKLRRDYLSIFIGFGILTIDSFAYFFEPNIFSAEAIKCLRKLHSALELTIVCVKRLGLPKEILSGIISDFLKTLENDKGIDINEFTFCIPPVKARNLLNLMRPVLWELSLVTSYNEKIKQSIHRFTTTPTRHHIIAPEKYPPKLMLETASYTYWKGYFIQENSQL